MKDHESGLPQENGWCTMSSPAEVCSAVPKVCWSNVERLNFSAGKRNIDSGYG